MKLATILKTIAMTAMLSSSFCFANEIPSNSLQVEYIQYSEKPVKKGNSLNLGTMYQIPTKTYDYLDEVFTSFYNTIIFNSTITDSTFESSAHHELISIPLIAENKEGLQIELFGNFTDPTTQRLSNCSEDQTLSHYYSNTEQLNMSNSELSVGAGISFNASQDSKIKVIISNSDMPGYGNSSALIGFEGKF